MASPQNYFGNMKKLNGVFTLLLLSFFSGNALLGQMSSIGPDELWPGRITMQPQYRYSTLTSAGLYQWAGRPPQGEQWVPNGDKGLHRLVANAQTGQAKYQQFWRLAPDGQVQTVQTWSSQQPDTIEWRYRYNPAGVLVALEVEGSSGYTYEQEPDTKSLRSLYQRLPLVPTALPSKDTLLIVENSNGQQHWFMLDAQERPTAYLAQGKHGELIAHWLYAYYDGADRPWAQRVVQNMQSRYQEKMWRSTTPEANLSSLEELETDTWYAAWGQGQRFYLHHSGKLLWQDHKEGEQVTGSWSRKQDELHLNLDNRRAAFVFKAEETAGRLLLINAETGGKWPIVEMQMATEELRAWANEVKAWASYTEGGRVGLQRKLDGRRLPAKYDAVEAATQAYGIVTLEGLKGIVSYDGQPLTPIYYQALSSIGEELLAAKKDNRYALMRPNGNPVTAYDYDRLLVDADGLRAVQASKMGIIDTTGRTVIPFRFDSLSTALGFNQRWAWLDGAKGVINAQGDWVIVPEACLQIELADTAAFIVQDLSGRWGLLRRDGEILVAPEYTHLRVLSPGVFVAQIQGKFGLISVDGRELTPIKYPMIKGCEPQAGEGLCGILLQNNAIAKFISEEGFGYLDAYGREQPPRLPSEERLKAEYETVRVKEQLELTFPKAKWRWEPTANRLYKQGDYGRVRVFYEWVELAGQKPEKWLEENLPGKLHQQLQRQEVGGQPAWVVTELKRIRYYDFRKKYAYIPLPKGQLLRLELSCKAANYIENAQDLYEIEQLLKVKP